MYNKRKKRKEYNNFNIYLLFPEYNINKKEENER